MAWKLGVLVDDATTGLTHVHTFGYATREQARIRAREVKSWQPTDSAVTLRTVVSKAA